MVRKRGAANETCVTASRAQRAARPPHPDENDGPVSCLPRGCGVVRRGAVGALYSVGSRRSSVAAHTAARPAGRLNWLRLASGPVVQTRHNTSPAAAPSRGASTIAWRTHVAARSAYLPRSASTRGHSAKPSTRSGLVETWPRSSAPTDRDRFAARRRELGRWRAIPPRLSVPFSAALWPSCPPRPFPARRMIRWVRLVYAGRPAGVPGLLPSSAGTALAGHIITRRPWLG